MKKKKVEKTIKCKHCGAENALGLEKCVNCNKSLDVPRVCPRCAKINESGVKKCIRCGYSFDSADRSFVVNFLLSCILVSSLLIINKCDPTVFKSLTTDMKRVAVIVVVLILIATLTYGRKDIKKYSAEEQIIDNTKIMKVRKVTSIILGILVAGVFIFVCFKYLIK